MPSDEQGKGDAALCAVRVVLVLDQALQKGEQWHRATCTVLQPLAGARWLASCGEGGEQSTAAELMEIVWRVYCRRLVMRALRAASRC